MIFLNTLFYAVSRLVANFHIERIDCQCKDTQSAVYMQSPQRRIQTYMVGNGV